MFHHLVPLPPLPEIAYKWVRGLLYAFKKVKNEISMLKNPYLDTKNAFLTHLEAKIWRNRISEGSSGF